MSLPTGDGGGVTLVTGTSARTLTVEGGTVRTVVDGAALTVAPRGETGALHAFLTETLPGRVAALDAFVSDLAAALNAQHAAGRDAEGAPGGALFTFDPSAGAARSMRVSADVLGDPRRLAAGGPDATGPHDARNADALAALRAAKVDGKPPFDGQLAAFVVELGARVATARSTADAQASLSVAATVARQGAHGVSLDEEMVALVAYQRALEAASRVMTAVDQALDVLVNRTGIVGR
jgi:flagellar hook-associated protein 1